MVYKNTLLILSAISFVFLFCLPSSEAALLSDGWNLYYRGVDTDISLSDITGGEDLKVFVLSENKLIEEKEKLYSGYSYIIRAPKTVQIPEKDNMLDTQTIMTTKGWSIISIPAGTEPGNVDEMNIKTAFALPDGELEKVDPELMGEGIFFVESRGFDAIYGEPISYDDYIVQNSQYIMLESFMPENDGYPRLLYTSDSEVEKLRERAGVSGYEGREPYKGIYENNVIAYAEKSYSGLRTDEKALVAKSAAFVCALETSERKCGQLSCCDKTLTILRSMETDVPPFLKITSWNPFKFRYELRYKEWLDYSESLIYYSQAYEMLRGYSGNEYGEVLTKIRKLANDLYGETCDASMIGYALGMDIMENNYKFKIEAGLGTAAIVHNKDGNADRWMREAEKGLDSVMDYQFVSEGGYGEGPHYLKFLSHNLLPFMIGYDKFTGEGKYLEQERIRKTYEWPVKISMPNAEMPAIDDSFAKGYFPAGIFSGIYGEEFYNWYAQRAGHDVPDELAVEYIVYYDDSIEPGEPDFGPSLIMPDSGQAVLRSDWSEDATYMLLMGEHGAARHGLLHEHPDATSFIIYAHKDLLAIDSGYIRWADQGKNEGTNLVRDANNHNLILVNNKGPPSRKYQEDWYDIVFDQEVDIDHAGRDANLKNFLTSRNMDYVEVSTSYEGVSFLRTVMSPEHDYFVILDYLSGSKTKEYKWLLHGNAGGTTGKTFRELKSNGENGAEWIRDNAKMKVAITTGDGDPQISSYDDYHEESYNNPEKHRVLRAAKSGRDMRFLSVIYPEDTINEFPRMRTLDLENAAGILMERSDGNKVIIIAHDKKENENIEWVELGPEKTGLDKAIGFHARLLVLEFTEDGEPKAVFAKDFLKAEYAGNVLAKLQKEADYSVIYSDDSIEGFSGDISGQTQDIALYKGTRKIEDAKGGIEEMEEIDGENLRINVIKNSDFSISVIGPCSADSSPGCCEGNESYDSDSINDPPCIWAPEGEKNMAVNADFGMFSDIDMDMDWESDSDKWGDSASIEYDEEKLVVILDKKEDIEGNDKWFDFWYEVNADTSMSRYLEVRYEVKSKEGGTSLSFKPKRMDGYIWGQPLDSNVGEHVYIVDMQTLKGPDDCQTYYNCINRGGDYSSCYEKCSLNQLERISFFITAYNTGDKMEVEIKNIALKESSVPFFWRPYGDDFSSYESSDVIKISGKVKVHHMIDNADSRFGNYSYKLEVDELEYGDEFWKGLYSEDINVTGNTTYTVSSYVKADKIKDGYATLSLHCKNAEEGFRSMDSWDERDAVFEESSEWVRKWGTFTTEDNAEKCRIYIFFSPPAYGTFRIDGVQFEEGNLTDYNGTLPGMYRGEDTACCGDDLNEYYICNIADENDCACCDSSDDMVYSGMCNPEGIKIKCYSDDDCGISGWLNQTFCNGSSVFDIYVNNTCESPGTTASYCRNINETLLKDECNETEECIPGGCMPLIIPDNETNCTDGIDNDLDNLTDCLDIDDCAGSIGPQGRYCCSGQGTCPNKEDGFECSFYNDHQCYPRACGTEENMACWHEVNPAQNALCKESLPTTGNYVLQEEDNPYCVANYHLKDNCYCECTENGYNWRSGLGCISKEEK